MTHVRYNNQHKATEKRKMRISDANLTNVMHWVRAHLVFEECKA